MNRHAFTLIELLIAIGLGTMIILVGYSAIRVSATSISTGNRLMNENALLRQAMLTGIEQIDFGAPGEFGIAGQDKDAGLSYTATAKPATSLFLPSGAINPLYAHLSRSALTYRPCEDWWSWRANIDANGWSYSDTGNGKFEFKPNVAASGFGNPPIRPRYQLDLEAPDDHKALRGMQDDAYQAMVNWGKTAQIDLYANFGYMAMLEYMPPNAVFYCGPLTKGKIISGQPKTVRNYGAGGDVAPKGTGSSATFMSAGSPFELSARLQRRFVNADDVADGGVASMLADQSDMPWGTLIDSKGAGRVGWDGNWMAARQDGLPADWPRCGVIIQRAWTDCLRLNRVEVKLRSPITGQDLSIAFNCVGPNLPGIRKSHGLHD